MIVDRNCRWRRWLARRSALLRWLAWPLLFDQRNRLDQARAKERERELRAIEVLASAFHHASREPFVAMVPRGPTARWDPSVLARDQVFLRFREVEWMTPEGTPLAAWALGMQRAKEEEEAEAEVPHG